MTPIRPIITVQDRAEGTDLASWVIELMPSTEAWVESVLADEFAYHLAYHREMAMDPRELELRRTIEKARLDGGEATSEAIQTLEIYLMRRNDIPT